MTWKSAPNIASPSDAATPCEAEFSQEGAVERQRAARAHRAHPGADRAARVAAAPVCGQRLHTGLVRRARHAHARADRDGAAVLEHRDARLLVKHVVSPRLEAARQELQIARAERHDRRMLGLELRRRPVRRTAPDARERSVRRERGEIVFARGGRCAQPGARLRAGEPPERLDDPFGQVAAKARDASEAGAAEEEARRLAAAPLAHGEETRAGVVLVERREVHAHQLEISGASRCHARKRTCSAAARQRWREAPPLDHAPAPGARPAGARGRGRPRDRRPPSSPTARPADRCMIPAA